MKLLPHNRPNQPRKPMSNIRTLKPFKIVAVALFVFAVLSIGSTAWGQYSQGIITIPGRVMNTPITTPPSYSDRVIEVVVPLVSGYPEYLDTSGLSFPITKNGVTLTSADVMTFFHRLYLPLGYYEVNGTPSLQQNCYGYATGKGLWLTSPGFDYVLLGYNLLYYGLQLGGKVVFKTTGHGVAAESTLETVGEERRGTVVKTKEKNGPSGIYGMDYNKVFVEQAPVSILLPIMGPGYMGMGVYTSGYYKER